MKKKITFTGDEELIKKGQRKREDRKKSTLNLLFQQWSKQQIR